MAMQLNSSAGGMQSAKKHLVTDICNCGAAAGAVAEQAEVNKQRIKYINTLTTATLSFWWQKRQLGFSDQGQLNLGHRIKQVSGEANSC